MRRPAGERGDRQAEEEEDGLKAGKVAENFCVCWETCLAWEKLGEEGGKRGKGLPSGLPAAPFP